MTSSRFWRLATSDVVLFQAVPAEIQHFSQSFGMRDKVRSGHGILVGDLNEATGCGEVRWLALVEAVDLDAELIRVNWRPAEITLKPTASGASYWRRKPWFGFAPTVAERYMLDALFADVFDDESWTTNSSRVILTNTAEAVPVRQVESLIAPHPVFPIAEPSRVPRVGYVYLVWSKYGYKIGKSVNVKQRTRLFSVKLPFEIRVEHYAKFNDYSQAETTLHRYFHNRRLDGEWFDLNSDDIALIKTFGDPQSVEGL